MRMMPLARMMAPAVLGALAVLASCGGDDGDDTDNGDVTPTLAGTVAPDNCAPNLALSLTQATWTRLFPAEVFEEDVWRVLRGRAEGPYVSVSLNREVVGAIELVQFPHESGFDPEAGIGALEAWADAFYAEAESEGASEHADYGFDSRDPEPANVGTFCGISYGFTETSGGEEVARLAGYATFDQAHIYLFVAQYDASQAGDAGFHEASTLADFEPVFASFVQTLGFPPGAGVTATPVPEDGDEPPAEE